jgi:hypothetical protein
MWEEKWFHAKAQWRKGKRIESVGNVLRPQSRKIINYFSLGILTLCVPGVFARNCEAFTQTVTGKLKRDI